MDASLGVKVMLIIGFFLVANVTMFKASLTLQSEAQTVLTKRLIKKIGDFSCNNPGIKKIMQFYLFIRRTMQGWNWFLYCVEKKLSSVQLHQIISSSSKSHLSFALHLQPAWNYILRLKKHVLSFISTDTVSTFLPMHILQAECLIFLPISPGSPDSDGGSLSNIHSLALALEQHVRLFSVFADFRFYKANDAISKTLLKSVFIL